MAEATFQRLPIEVNASIAGYLDDADLCNFTLVCRNTHAAVNCKASPAWRQLFQRAFDISPCIGNEKLKNVYQVRKKWLNKGTDSTFFRAGRSSNEQACLRVLRSLINESFVRLREDNDCETSLNLEVLSRFVDNSMILVHFLDPRVSKKVNPLLLVIQVMMIHFQLNQAMFTTTLNFPVSQKAVYASVQEEPMFLGPNRIEINMHFAAHTLNFFKHHMTHPEEGLYHTYTASAANKVNLWRKRLVNGAQSLGKKWAGVYAYLDHDELAAIRQSPAGDRLVLDNLNGEDQGGELQTLELHFPEEHAQWPHIFEKHLTALGHPSATYLDNVNMEAARKFAYGRSRTRAQRRVAEPENTDTTKAEEPIDPRAISFQFTGKGIDAEDFYASGWLNPLPPQQGIPGWQRMSMMKFFVDQEFESEEDGDGHGKFDMSTALGLMDETSLWAYEGVVLPGGEIVVGRWWSPSAPHQGVDEECYSGPFMFWCID